VAETVLTGRAEPAGRARWSPAGRVSAVTLAALLVTWEAVARSGLLYQDVVPPLEKVVVAFGRLLASADTYQHLGVTAWEVGAGFALGLAAGLAAGILMGARRLLGDAATPYVEGLATAPKIVFLPVAMLALGVGIQSKIALGALSAFFPVALNTAAGMREIRPVLVQVGRSFGLSAWQMARRIYLPALARSVVISMRLGLGVAVVGVVLAEIKLANRGLGFLAIEHYSHFRIPQMYAVLLLVFVLAIAANALLGRLLPRR
jgi:ABC-type nitrate/sulfonate/bicarbonate transport system permease component